MKYGLIGEKLGHSYSKIIHERLIDDYEYEIHPIPKDELDSFMRKKDFSAINVTIPYKQDVMPYLDEIEEAAKEIGAVNTIVNRDGKLCGYNTDYLGFLYTLKKHDIRVKNKKVLIMGNGGASKAIQNVITSEQAKEVVVVDLIKTDGVITLEEAYQHHSDCEIIINTTPVGMYPNIDQSSVDLLNFPQCSSCVDAIYNPLRTNFTLQAQSLGMKGISGLEMLVAQAKYALELFKDITIDDQEIDRIYHEILLETSNIVLIGMPGSGKTTIGQQTSEKLNKAFIDIDAVIVEKIQMPIADFFKLNGEAAFRKIESETCFEVSSKSNTVISCGGGIVKNPKNIFNLKHNGLIFCIERDLELLISDDTRPLSSNRSDVEKLYKERKGLYLDAQENCIQNQTTIEEAVEQTIQVYKDNIKNINK